MGNLIKIDDSGLDNLKRVIDALQRWDEVVERVIKRHLDVIVKDSKRDAPVDTGALRDSIKSLGVQVQSDIIGAIEVGVPYASFVEKRQGFLEDNIDDSLKGVVQDLRDEFERLLR